MVFRSQASRFPEGHTLLVPGGAWSAEAAKNRLASTLFLAALFHGIVILGVTFSGEPARRAPATTSLEVVIVTRDYEKRVAPAAPALLADQNLLGRGNARLNARLRTALPAPDDPARPGLDQAGTGNSPARQGTARPAKTPLTAAARDQPTVLPREKGESVTPAQLRPLWRADIPSTELLTQPEETTVIPDANPREVLVSANTRESRIAGYLNSWKMRVERIGTLNFPPAAETSRVSTYPVLEVAIGADGSLRDVLVRTSSGQRSLDQAAMDILRIAAPFEPFPQQLREDYDVLRFAYEWHFGRGGSGRVTEVNGS